MAAALETLDSLISLIDTGSNDGSPARKIPEQPRITELPNEMSSDIDVSSPIEILRILRTCDSQIFSGWRNHPNLYDFIPIMRIIIRHLQRILADPQHNKVIFSGCGTSGRLGWATARALNRFLRAQGHAPCFDYCIAGHDKALLTSQELYEDDPTAGVEDLVQRTKDAKQVLFIGITCGLSAPYVGGQIEYATKQNNFVTVLMGFNPADLSRNSPCEKWKGKTLRRVCVELSRQSPKPQETNKVDEQLELHCQILLNPIFGPETITGSSRMKSGSGTKILLDVMCTLGCYCALGTHKEKVSNPRLNALISSALCGYEGIYRRCYDPQHLTSLAKLCDLCGDTLQTTHGRVVYVGGAVATSIVAFIDASEMKPTFGTALKRFRAYFFGGWSFLENAEGDLSHIDDRFRVHPQNLDVGSLTQQDVVVVVGHGDAEVTKLLKSAKCKLARIRISGDGDDEKELDTKAESEVSYAVDVCVDIRGLNDIRKTLAEGCPGLLAMSDACWAMFATKLLLNGVSTAAHVLSGTVLRNRMINVRVSNDKLFYRSLSLVEQFGGVDETTAHACLLKAIYGDVEFADKAGAAVSSHIVAARDVDKIVPVAIVLAAQMSKPNEARMTTQEIRAVLDAEPSVRKVLTQYSFDSH